MRTWRSCRPPSPELLAPFASWPPARTLSGVNHVPAVTVVVARRTTSGFEVAVVGHRRRRAWELVRGRVRRTERPADAAARETLEETGFVPVSVMRVGSVSTSRRAVYIVEVAEGRFSPSREIKRLVWADPASAMSMLARSEQRFAAAALRKLTRRDRAAAVDAAPAVVVA